MIESNIGIFIVWMVIGVIVIHTIVEYYKEK